MSIDENDILFGQNSLTHDEYIPDSDTKQHGVSRDGNRYWESGIWRWPGKNKAKLQTTFSRREGTDFWIDLHVTGYVRNRAVINGRSFDVLTEYDSFPNQKIMQRQNSRKVFHISYRLILSIIVYVIKVDVPVLIKYTSMLKWLILVTNLRFVNCQD